MKKNRMIILAAVSAVAVVVIIAVLLMAGGGSVEAIVCRTDSQAVSGTMTVTEGKVKIDITAATQVGTMQIKALVTGNDAYLNMPALGNVWYKVDVSSIPGMDTMGMAQFKSMNMQQLKAQMGTMGQGCSVIQVPASEFQVPAGASVQSLPAGTGGFAL